VGKKPKKVKDKCCEKYLKSGKHCKNCPLMLPGESGAKKKGRDSGGKAEKKKKDKPGKKKKETKK
jgi:hypothetical protein